MLFHLLIGAGDAAALAENEIGSRHPALLALRNVIKVAWDYGICELSIPLLLGRRLDDEAACIRRAETVLKCLKGYMIEMTTFSLGEDGRTIELVLPRAAPLTLMNHLANILVPSVFRVINPVTV